MKNIVKKIKVNTKKWFITILNLTYKGEMKKWNENTIETYQFVPDHYYIFKMKKKLLNYTYKLLYILYLNKWSNKFIIQSTDEMKHMMINNRNNEF